MGLFKQRQNKKFSYKPRHYKYDGEGSPFEMRHKFDDFRTTVGKQGGLKTRFKTAWNEFRESSDRETNRRILIIVCVLILLFLFIIDFDLSIFFSKQ
ncbi:riboflavin synthase subunit beta [Mangrovimonas aestuarii]|uniref:riboflavin synthase subunit beta n=1 Tax=Mangrovimonas aestuarii TaxID=3018443 RepID=UPI00237924D8|nr:riboflavin synthase subunit beta [Mangrovimonas aestuarii]